MYAKRLLIVLSNLAPRRTSGHIITIKSLSVSFYWLSRMDMSKG